MLLYYYFLSQCHHWDSIDFLFQQRCESQMKKKNGAKATWKRYPLRKPREKCRKSHMKKVSEVLHINTLGGKKQICSQKLQENQMKKLSLGTVRNNTLQIYGSIIWKFSPRHGCQVGPSKPKSAYPPVTNLRHKYFPRKQEKVWLRGSRRSWV